MVYSGGCACGRISFTTDGELLGVTWCYCVTCQKQSGAPFLPFADFEKATISWTQQPDVWSSSEIAERYFCKDCGSTVGMRYFFEPNRFFVTVGLIAGGEASELAPGCHIFLKDKPIWFQLPDDGTARREEFSTAYAQRIDEYEKKHGAN